LLGNSAALYAASTWILPVLIAVPFHEAAHGFVAHRLGDDTAWRMGRVTFNPLRHIDPFGTVVLPLLLFITGGFLFGYAKPVPVNFRALRPPRLGSILVAAAGPAMNIALALAAAFLFYAIVYLPPEIGRWTLLCLAHAVELNIVLAVFNMLPIPPLDGGRVAVGILPRPLALPLARLEPYGLLIILGLLFVLPWIGEQVHLNLDVLRWVLTGPVDYLVNLVAVIAGLGNFFS
jgi:Zn-dependent protease